MPSAEPESNELFDVVILRFDTRSESAAERLQRVFGMQPMAAETLLAELPATVRRGVNRVRAEYFRRALIAIGAKVEVHDASGKPIAAETAAAAPAPRPLQPKAANEPELRAARVPTPVDPANAHARALPLPAANPPPRTRPCEAPQPQAQASVPLRAAPLEAANSQAGPQPAAISFAPARSGGASTLLRGSASPRPFPAPRPPLDSETAGPHQLSWGMLEAANDLAPLVLPAAAPTPAARGLDATNPAALSPDVAFADTPETPLALTENASLRPVPEAPAWGELDRGPAPSPRPRARRQQQPNAAPSLPAPLERIGQLSAPPLQLQSLPTPARSGAGESSRPSARRGNRPEAKPPQDGHDVSGPPMLGRFETETVQPRSAAPPSGPPLTMQSLPSPGRRALVAPEGARPIVVGHATPSRPGTAGAGQSARGAGPSSMARSAAVEARSFWECLPEALIFPFLGRGVFWVIGITVWAIGANLLSALSGIVPLAGASVGFFANTSVIAMCADYHRRCMWAVANADDELDEGPDFDPARILHGYMRSGAQLAIFMAVSQLPLVFWIASAVFSGGLAEGLETFGSPLFWLLAFGPACYWPAAVACASLYNRYSGVWFVPVGVRLIARAPLEYLAILFVGGSAFLLPWLFAVIVGKAADLPGAFFAAATGLPLALSHALMGSLTGQLMRTRPDAFE